MFIKDNDVKKKLDDIDKSAKNTNTGVTNLNNNFSGFGNTLGKIGKGLAVAGVAIGTALIGGSGYAIKLASDLGEVQNVVDTTFGNNAEEINTWSKNAAEAFGLSELQAKKMTGSLGAMMKSMGLTDTQVKDMSTSMVGLAGDFASFYNLDGQEAFDKIRAGISGETEPLKQLGINMSVANLEAYALAEGIKKPYKEMSQAEQTQLRYNYLMNVSKDAQGDFAKTSDSLANQMRITKLQIDNLASSLGQGLLPIAQNVLGTFRGELKALMDAFNQGGLEGMAVQLGTSLANIVNKLLEYVPQFIETGTKILVSLIEGVAKSLPNLITKVMEIIPTIVKAILDMLPMLIQVGLDIIVSLALGIANMLPKLIPTIVDVVLKIIDTLIDNIDMLIDAGIELMLGLLDGIINALPRIIEKLPEILVKLTDAIIRNSPKFLEAGMKLFEMLMEGITKVAIASVTAVGKLIQDYTVKPIKDKITEFTEVGKNLLEGLWNGINDKVEWLKGKVKGVVDTIKKIFTGKEGFDEHSPSRWARQVAQFVMDGLGLGVEDGELPLMEKTKKMLGNLKTFITNTLSSMGIFSENTQLKYELWGITEGKNASEADKLDKKLENLTKQQEEQGEVVDVLNLAYEEAVKLYGENSVESVELENQLLKEKIAYENLSKAIYEVVEAKQKLIQDSQPKVEEPKPLANSNPSGFAEAYANFEKLLQFGYSKEDQMAYAMQYASASGKGFDFVPVNSSLTNKGNQPINLTMGDIVIQGNTDKDTVNDISDTVRDAFSQFVGQLQQTAMIHRAV